MRMVEGPAAFVLNGDTFVRAPLEELEAREACALSVLVAQVDDASRYGTVVVSDGRVAGFREKGVGGPGLVNCGVYWITKAALARIAHPVPFSFENDFLEPCALQAGFCAVVTGEPFVDIGIPEALAAAAESIPFLAAGDERRN